LIEQVKYEKEIKRLENLNKKMKSIYLAQLQHYKSICQQLVKPKTEKRKN